MKEMESLQQETSTTNVEETTKQNYLVENLENTGITIRAFEQGCIVTFMDYKLYDENFKSIEEAKEYVYNNPLQTTLAICSILIDFSQKFPQE